MTCSADGSLASAQPDEIRSNSFPDVAFGSSRLIGVFSGPDFAVARKVSRIVAALRSVKAELALLRNGS